MSCLHSCTVLPCKLVKSRYLFFTICFDKLGASLNMYYMTARGQQWLLAEASNGLCEFAGVSQNLVDDEGNERDHERSSEGEEVT